MGELAVRWVLRPWTGMLIGWQRSGAAATLPDASPDSAESLWRRWQVSSGVAPADLFAHLIPQSIRLNREDDLAAGCLRRLLGSVEATPLTPGLVRALGAARRESMAGEPASGEQIEADAASLREAWDRHGSRVMDAIAQLTVDDWLVESAEVLLAPAALAPGGEAFPAYNAAWIAAAPADPTPELPELLRLVWLLAQLNADLPKFQGNLMRGTSQRIAALALAPVVLHAAEETEIILPEQNLLARALATWTAEPTPEELAPQVARWWTAYQSSRPSWTAALGALAAMLDDPGV